MSLRSKLLLLWGGLAVAPLLAIGVFEYFHSVRTLRTLIASQAAAISDRAALEVEDSYARRISDLLLVGENAETRRLYEAHAAGNPESLSEAREAAEEYLSQAWELFGSAYLSMELQDSDGIPLLRLGSGGNPSDTGPSIGRTGLNPPATLTRSVPDPGGEGEAGRVVAYLPLDRLLPREALETSFGRSGFSTVIDRTRGQVLHHPRHGVQGGSVTALTGPSGWQVDPEIFQQERGTFSFQESDSTRVASFTSLSSPPWTVIAIGTLEEFAPAVAGMRVLNLFLVLLVAGIASAAFIVVTRRGTRSLIALTAAADQVGAGDFRPPLPESGQDEVGRLTTAFGLMAAKVEEMVRQIETSRQMAVVGEFASQISHEIRNPLTALKLNLQTLQRAADSGRIPEDQGPSLDTCLQEIQRLDRVVRGVLALGRSHSAAHGPCSVHEVLQAALRVCRSEAGERGIQVETGFEADSDQVWGDAEKLEAAFLNLLLNSLHAVEDGGRILVATNNLTGGGGTGGTEAGGTISILVADDGPGVPPEARDQVFRPFYSTKPSGSGFGLPLALRTFEEHGGSLSLEEGENPLGGAAFYVHLPVQKEPLGP